jgi:Mn-dependent DtxR family transcriptional regulator
MLDAMLRLVAREGVTAVDEMARRLGVEPALVMRLLSELERLGYLAPVGACHAPCGNCATREACRSIRAPRSWTLTQKGADACRRRERGGDGSR